MGLRGTEGRSSKAQQSSLAGTDLPAAAVPGPGSAGRTTRPPGAGGLPCSTAPSHTQEWPQEVTRGILLPVWETWVGKHRGQRKGFLASASFVNFAPLFIVRHSKGCKLYQS